MFDFTFLAAQDSLNPCLVNDRSVTKVKTTLLLLLVKLRNRRTAGEVEEPQYFLMSREPSPSLADRWSTQPFPYFFSRSKVMKSTWITLPFGAVMVLLVLNLSG